MGQTFQNIMATVAGQYYNREFFRFKETPLLGVGESKGIATPATGIPKLAGSDSPPIEFLFEPFALGVPGYHPLAALHKKEGRTE